MEAQIEAAAKAPKDPNPPPVFHVGDDRMKRMSDPTVAVALAVNVTIDSGDRKLSCTAALHEVPLLRRLYLALGGTVVVRPDWVPGLKRRSKLSNLQLQDELKRLSEKYVIPTESGKRDIAAEILGSTGAERLRALRDLIREAEGLWRALEDVAMSAIRAAGIAYHPTEVESLIADRLNQRDIDHIVRQMDPAEVTADTIDLEGIDGDHLLQPAGQAGAAPAAADEEPSERLSPAEVFGDEDERGPMVDASAELSDADLLIADLRTAGLDAADANRAALVIVSYPDAERGEKMRGEGFKGKELTAVLKAGKQYDAATAAPKA